MTKLKITEEQIKRASSRFEFDELNGSITKGGGNLAGAIGEVVVIDYLRARGSDVKDISTYDYDIISNHKTIDVKTKRINVEPRDNYRSTVSGWNTKQRCHYYVFVYVHSNMKDAYLAGYMPKKEFFEKAVFYKTGDKDPEDVPGRNWTFAYDCYVMNNKDLYKL